MYRSMILLLLVGVLVNCQSDPSAIPFSRIQPRRNICQVDTQTFRNWRDFTGYTIPGAPDYDDGAGTKHSLQVLTVGDQSFTTYKATIYAASTKDHAAYATLQYASTPSGVFTTPVYIDFYFLIQGLTIPQNGFISIAKFTPDGDVPQRYITLDIDSTNTMHFSFVPNQQGATQWIYKNTNNPIQSNRWYNMTVYLDYSASGGIAAVWQDGAIQCVANVNGGNGLLKQMHLGVIGSGSISSGTVYNYNLVTQRVCTETTTTTTLAPSPSDSPVTTTTTTTSAPSTPSTTQRTPTIPIPTPDATTSTNSPGTDRNSAALVTVSLVALILSCLFML